ncbi:hypothetical protein BJY04DRAFT_173480 [Aspergillus karnatakaensis]|uniref:BRcat and Rcat domain-containing protein n=1 Tax=Aspergillus karnatakaensis TaxID=1810916 RepID=UPI003CCC926D
MVSYGEERRREWRQFLDATLNDFSSISSVAPFIDNDLISPVSEISQDDLPLAPQPQHSRSQSRRDSYLNIIDAVSPLGHDEPWNDNFWSDATTAGAVLSLLNKEPVGHPDERPSGDERTGCTICCACLEDLEPEHYPAAPISTECDHTPIPSTQICTVCLSRSLDVQFATSRAALLICPLCHSQLSDEEVERWASVPTFAAYDTARTLRALEGDGEFVRCNRPNCGYGQLHGGGLEDPVVICGACGARTCFIHRNIPWHEGLTCAEYEAIDPLSTTDGNRMRELPPFLRAGLLPNGSCSSEEFLSQRTIQETTRACPGCSAATERAGGCKYMRCGMCWREWCWDCGINWERGHLGVDCSIF